MDDGGKVMPTPTSQHGKICYLEIPALDPQQSADFYTSIFGWPLRRHSDGALAFDDTIGEVSGMWVTDRKPATEPGIIVSIMVANAAETSAAIVAAGGEIVEPADPEADAPMALFRDPAGNVLRIYQDSDAG
jgi:predicted enzyme related to lactoylglutathione lyase